MKEKIIEQINKILENKISKKIYNKLFKDKLSHKVIKINIQDIDFDICLKFNDQCIILDEQCDKFDVEISGTLTSFIQ